MNDIEVLVNSYLLQRAHDGLLALTVAIAALIILAVVFTAVVLKKEQRRAKNAEQPSGDNAQVPSADCTD